MSMPDRQPGWSWFDGADSPVEPEVEIGRLFVTCFAGTAGEQALQHLQRVFLDRRVPPSASDAELRHAEGQRCVVAYIQGLIERGREPRGDRS